MARNIIFESLATDTIKSGEVYQGYLSINDNKNINNDLISVINDVDICVIYDDNLEVELPITNREIDSSSALKSFICEFDGGFIKTDNITNVRFYLTSKKVPIKFLFYKTGPDIPVMLKSGGLRSGNSNEISKIKLSNTTYNIKDSTARTDILSKQDTLVSGTNIKTINNESILGSGNINIQGGGNIEDVTVNGTSIINSEGVAELNIATDSVAGVIKLNSDKSIDVDENGNLVVGGRLGQFPTTTGLFAPNDREPRGVADYSMLITDAIGVDMTTANRSMAVVSGYGISLKSSTAAGSTEYHIENNYENRIICKLAENGYASLDEATSRIEQIIPVTSVLINGATFTPDSSADDSSNDIIITTEESLNPDSAATKIRLFGKISSYATMHVGNGIKSEGGGRSLLLGGGVSKTGSTNDNALIGYNVYSSGNGNFCFGRNIIARKNRSLLAGTGHDTTNARTEGASAVGLWSNITSNTMFAVGNGTSHRNRINIFEVKDDGRVKSSGTPTDNDDLTTKSYVDSKVGGNYTTIQLGTTWTGTAPSLQQTVQVTGVTSSDNPDLSVIATNATTFDNEYLAWSKVWKAESGAGTITFYAYESTETAITIAVKW